MLIFERMSLATIGRELTAYLHLLLHRRPSNVRVLIFGQGRTGSTLLEDLLCSTGHFAKHGELLRKRGKHIQFPAAFVKGSARRLGDRNFICHVKPSHLRDDRHRGGAGAVDLRGFLRSIEADGFKIIHLKRSDQLGQFLSMRMAEARGGYHKRDDLAETQRVIVDRTQLEQSLEQRRHHDEQESAALEGFDLIEVEYEADLANSGVHQATIDRILDSLSLPRRPVRTSLRKVNRRPLREIVENYEEFKTWVSEIGVERRHKI